MKVNIPAFGNAKVLVVGDIMLDRYWHGSTQRISPEAPVPVVRIGQDEERPGGAANVALNIAALGGQVSLVGIVGNDDNATKLKKSLENMKVKCLFQECEELPTITKLRIISRNQQLIRLDFEDSLSKVKKHQLQKLVEDKVAEHDLLVISDYQKGTLSDVEPLIAIAREKNIPVLVDPKGQDFTKYRGATIMTPNLSEFEGVVGACHDEQQLINKGHQLIKELQLDALLVTRSENGMTLLKPNVDELHLPTEVKEVYDVTGAGDTVIATLAVAIAAEATYAQACALANIAAGIVVGKLGTSTVSEVELSRALSTGQESSFGVLSEEQLKLAIEHAKNRGEKIVMTNGCFDILHAGHVSYLANAGELGDRLIVAVNDDDSVKRLKGEGRPINPVDRRMAVLAGLGAVDWVVSFSEDTPQRLISGLLPDILVKGGDYQVEDIAGGKEVIANGGEVQVLNFEDGISTTEIINTIRLDD